MPNINTIQWYSIQWLLKYNTIQYKYNILMSINILMCLQIQYNVWLCNTMQ